MFKHVICLKSTPRPPAQIPDFNAFFLLVQQRTGFFYTHTSPPSRPYHLYPQQQRWMSLFDRHRPIYRALLASRDKGKSQIVTILGSAWQIYRTPHCKIAIMAFTCAQAQQYVHQIVQILTVLGFPIIHRHGGFYTLHNHDHTPSILPLGLMSSIRGLHFDYLIMDDPLTIHQQYSPAAVARSRAFFHEAASLARAVILIGQLLTRQDLYYDVYGDASGRYYLLQSWHGDIPELDKDLEYLTATIGRKEVARNYLGYIDDAEEAIFQSIQLDSSAVQGAPFAFIDPASKGQDCTAVAIGWTAHHRLIIHGYLFKQHWGLCLDAISQLCRACALTYYEDNLGSAFGHFLRQKGVKAVGITTTANKIAKIYALRGLIISDRLRLCDRMQPEAIQQVQQWIPSAPHDDLPDAIAMLAHQLGWIFSSHPHHPSGGLSYV